MQEINHPTQTREKPELSQGKQWKKREMLPLAHPLWGGQKMAQWLCHAWLAFLSVCPRQAVQGCVDVLCSCFSWKFHICWNEHACLKKGVCGSWWITSSVKDSRHPTEALLNVWSSLLIFVLEWALISHRIFLSVIQSFLLSTAFPTLSLSLTKPCSSTHLSRNASWCSSPPLYLTSQLI